MRRKRLIVIVGPTAVGKTSVAISLAEQLHTEIICADSRQIFKEMNLGTAKPSDEELSAVPHHFINSHSIKDAYSAAEYGRDALILIHRLFEKYDSVILCGGSGLYVKAVCEGFDKIPEVPERVRADLIAQYEANGLAWLQQKMADLDPDYYTLIDRNNPQRLMRALEVVIGTGKSISSFQNKNKLTHTFDIVKIGLELDREELYQRINVRMDDMIAQGLFEEAKSLYNFKDHNALQTVGYQEVFGFIDGQYNYDETVQLLKRNSRRYAKRQMTWFKRDLGIHWFNPNAIDSILKFLDNKFQVPDQKTSNLEP
jgi:tRNA dimethylallyltransferase